MVVARVWIVGKMVGGYTKSFSEARQTNSEDLMYSTMTFVNNTGLYSGNLPREAILNVLTPHIELWQL